MRRAAVQHGVEAAQAAAERAAPQLAHVVGRFLRPEGSGTRRSAALSPAPMAQRLRSLAPDLNRRFAPNSQRLWLASWRVWRAFCAQQAWPILPASVDSLRAFLEARRAEGRARATVEGNLWTLELIHRLIGGSTGRCTRRTAI